MTEQQIIDCRGLQCPEPILRLASAARKVSGVGTIVVRADDEAFPLDVKSWCKSSGAELLKLDRTVDGFAAEIKVAGRAPKTERTVPVFQRTLGLDAAPEVLLDCRGLACPEPILRIAKAARAATGPLRVTADDPAFELDLKSWCRTTGATLISLEAEGDVLTAVVHPKSAQATTRSATLEAAATPTPPMVSPAGQQPSAAPQQTITPSRTFAADLDLRAVQDPLDLESRLAGLTTVCAGLPARVTVASSVLAQKVVRWASDGGHTIDAMSGAGPVVVELGMALSEERAPFSRSTAMVAANADSEVDCALLVLHNDLEALLAALLVANGAAAQGQRVVLFFTFWGLNLLRGDRPNEEAPREKVSFIQRVFKWFMPKGPRRQQLGQLNFGGMGPVLLRGLMRDKNLTELPRLVDQAVEQGVKFVACTMSMSVMGITKRDLAPYKNLELGGVAYFVAAARGAQMSLVF
ncbi:MAG: DsrE/DsrF/DrsH-like family protein [Myxococcales bacterium]|nr:DsrE/DsrF/DrsH-like family protein [Myxococcales bacterium]